MNVRPIHKTSRSLLWLLLRFMPSCRDTAALISRGMDERLPLPKRLSIRLHVGMCRFCRRYEKQLRALREGASRYGDPDRNEVAKSLSLEARARMEKALADLAK